MRIYHFSEVPYPWLPDFDNIKSFRVELPNRNFDPAKGADNYHARLDEWCLADELGLDIMLNEHHQTITCTVPAIVTFASILARQTKNARILELGNPVANRGDPIRVAEETAMVDVISRGRLDCGFVRGVPFEIAPSNSSALGMRERLWEAADLITKAWTTHDGPFNWEGKYFHYRQVNVWPRPYQQPHPPLWMPTGSTGSAAELGRRGWVCAAFLQGYERTKMVYDSYRETYRETHGRDAPDDRFGFLGFCSVGETDAKAREGAEKLLWYLASGRVAPQWATPPGYLPPEAYVSIQRGGTGQIRALDIDTQIEVGNMFAGTPETVARQLETFYDKVGGVGHMLLMGHAGHMTFPETAAHLNLLAKEVYPRVRELGSVTVPA